MSVAPLVEYDTGSYRDWTSRVFYANGEVYRALSQQALDEWDDERTQALFERLMDDGKLVRTEWLSLDDAPTPPPGPEWAGVVRHERIPFVSYPYEWSFGMLKDAALLHLELLQTALDEDMILKDATPFNVQWRGSRPVFIDLPSFIRWRPGDPWIGYRQFCQLFLYPLLLQAYRNLPFQPWLRGSLEGIDPEHCLSCLSWRDFMRPGVLTHVFLHAQLQKRFRSLDASPRQTIAAEGFQKELIHRNLSRLTALVNRLSWKTPPSLWSEYATQADVAQRDGDEKARFVEQVARSHRWGLVWDLGCNTGRYSRLAAQGAEYVVAMDSDPVTIERLYRDLKAENETRVLPLLIDLANPSPNLGWRGQERLGLAERGRPTLTLCLALVHHLVIGANIPIASLIDWLASLDSHLVIEFVDKPDPMVQALLRNKSDQYADYGTESFERQLAQRFEIRQRVPLPTGTRTLYLAAPYNRRDLAQTRI